jgi:hypothetical protein
MDKCDRRMLEADKSAAWEERKDGRPANKIILEKKKDTV